jgi:PPK2 family polyphosphate:nucleotide phosphotransferase
VAVDPVRACRVSSGFSIADHDPGETFGWTKQQARDDVVGVLAEVSEMQKRLFASKAAAVLLVLQAMDAGGKDGTIRDVFTALNPAGIEVSSFNVPSDDDLAHDYLWRVHRRTPSKGRIGIFNRSHYEDVLVVRVKELVPKSVWSKRYGHILEFERMLTDEGTHVFKIFLNISKEEQRERLQDRIDDPSERWKFRRGDLDERARWDDYMEAFQDALAQTSTDHAPWYVVPGDRKWVRNLVVARILHHHLSGVDCRYPPPEPGLEGLVVE